MDVNRKEPEHPSAQQRLGTRLRELRLERKLSARTLAERCAVSPSFVSQVESGQASPSIASLEKFTHALGVGMSDLFEPGPTVSPYVTRSGQRKRLASSWSRAVIEAVLVPGESNELECILITLRGGGSNSKRPQQSATEQVVFVVDGYVTLELSDNAFELARGDAALVPAGSEHRLVNGGLNPCQVLLTAPRSIAGAPLYPTTAEGLAT